MSYGTFNVTATGNASVSGSTLTNCVQKNPNETAVTVALNGAAFAGVAFKFVYSPDGTNWYPAAAYDNSTQLPIAGSTTISPTDDTEYSWTIPNALNMLYVGVNVSSYTSGTATFSNFGGFGQFTPVTIISATSGAFTTITASSTLAVTGAASFSSTITGTSASASALAVGRLGATTPALQVDASTGTSITGVKVKSAATGGGVAISAVGETNVPLTIDGNGTGVLSLNSTATGTVYLGRGALTGPVFGKTITALGTTQSSTPTIAQLLGGIVTQTGQTGAGAVTLPTGTAISAGMPLTPATGDSFGVRFANLGGSQTLTITGQTGSTVVGTATVSSGTNIDLVFVCSGSNTWNVYTNK